MKKNHKTSIGGQALIEGILMRGPLKMSVALRTSDGNIVIKNEEISTLGMKYNFFRLPFIRGIVGLFEAMKYGMNALSYSADVYGNDDPEKENNENEDSKPSIMDKIFGDKKDDVISFISMSFSILMAILLFIFIPTWLTAYIKNFIKNPLALNFIEGIIRIIIFLLYIMGISKSKEMYRILQYHGAEHKSIHCYENGEELTVENIRKYSRLHPRCGTSFIFTVVLISMFVLAFFGWPSPVVRLLVRLIMFPVIVGISYELNKILGRSDKFCAKLFVMPGLWLQRVATVKEPEDEMIEVAIEALKEVIPAEEGLDVW